MWHKNFQKHDTGFALSSPLWAMSQVEQKAAVQMNHEPFWSPRQLVAVCTTSAFGTLDLEWSCWYQIKNFNVTFISIATTESTTFNILNDCNKFYFMGHRFLMLPFKIHCRYFYWLIFMNHLSKRIICFLAMSYCIRQMAISCYVKGQWIYLNNLQDNLF